MQNDFGWLTNPRGRRGSLALVHTAVRRGWLSGPGLADRRAELVRRLAELAADPATRPREVIRLNRILMAMRESSEVQ